MQASWVWSVLVTVVKSFHKVTSLSDLAMDNHLSTQEVTLTLRGVLMSAHMGLRYSVLKQLGLIFHIQRRKDSAIGLCFIKNTLMELWLAVNQWEFVYIFV